MAGKPWSLVDVEKLKGAWIAGRAAREIARELGRTKAGVEQKVAELQVDQQFMNEIKAKRAKVHASADVVSWVPPLEPDVEISGDQFLTGDWHLDKHWVELVQRLFDEKRRLGRHGGGRQVGLCIVGDFLNGDCYGSYPKGRSTSAAMAEFEAAEVMLDRLLTVFHKITICLGNHDARLLTLLQGADSTGDMPFQRVARLFLPEVGKGRIKVGNYFWMTVNDRWRLTHPKNYSRNAGITGKALATKHQMNISVAHEHHLAWCKDVTNRYQVINQGCMIDPKKADYVYERDSTSPEWNPGFVLVQDSIKQVTLFDGVEGYKVVAR